jgi:hypothetical protein
MKDIFPDFPLQLWGAFEKYKVDEKYPLSSYYSKFCDYFVGQVLILLTFKSQVDNIVNIYSCFRGKL